MTACALWYWRHYVPTFVLCDDEEEAARLACAISDDGSGSIAGVQREDGTYTPREEWVAYQTAQDRATEEAMRWAAEQRANPRPLRRVGVPGERDQTVNVDADTPEWVGVPLATGRTAS